MEGAKMNKSFFKVLNLLNAKNGQTLNIIAGHVVGFDKDQKTNTTFIYTPAGVFSVKESEEELRHIINQTVSEEK